MMKFRTTVITVGIAMVLLFCCNSCDKSQESKESPDISVALEIVSDISSVRATETSWHNGDQIGVYAVESGKGFSPTTLFNKASNLCYTTPNGDGLFAPAEGAEIRLMPDQRVDIISYYPYQPVGADYKLRVNVSDQSDLTKIDLLYSQNAKGLNATHPKANLQFDHVMSQLQISAMSDGNIDLSQLKVSIEGVVTEGVFDLPSGTFSQIGTTTAKVQMHQVVSVSKGATLQAILLPTQQLKGLIYHFEVGGQTYTYEEKEEKALKSGTREHRNFKITATGVELINATIEIIGKGDEGTVPGTEEPENPSKPEPSEPSGEFTNIPAYYKEQVLIRKGYMEDVYFQQHNAPDHWFGGGSTPGGNRRNYTIYYSTKNYQPYMIAYPLYRDCVGGLGRNENWEYDPEIPAKYQMNLTKSYVSGYSRGHMLRSANRSASKDLMHTTYYFTNMVPQHQDQNGGIWLQLEDVELNWAKSANKADTMFVVCGPIITDNNGTVTDRDGYKQSPIPTHTWKVLLKKKGNNWISIGVKMPNTSNAERPNKDMWYNEDYLCTVAELEQELGVKFFPHLSDAEATQVKSQKNRNDW